MFAKRLGVTALAVAGLAAGSALGLAASSMAGGEPERGTIHGAMSVDVEQPSGVMRNSASVVVADVLEVVSTDTASAMTTFRVEAGEQVKGTAKGELLVTQNGMRTEEHHYELEDQPLLEVGKRYLLALNPHESGYTVLGGPKSVRLIGSDADRRSVVAEYRAHHSDNG